MTAGVALASEYDIPARSGDAEITVRSSRFVARVERASSREAAMSVVARVAGLHPRARHHCWAYRAGAPGVGDGGSSDDGEPAGTAGRPILAAIQQRGMGDTVLVVSRYFGGVKLGAGGLARAYAQAAHEVLSDLALARHKPYCTANLRLDFSREHAVREWLADREGMVESVHYGDGVGMRLSLPAADAAALNAFCAAQGIICEVNGGAD